MTAASLRPAVAWTPARSRLFAAVVLVCAIGMPTVAATGPTSAPPKPGAPVAPSPPPSAAAAPASSVDLRIVGFSATRERSQREDDRRAEIAGRLIHTIVTLRVENATVAEVLGDFARAVKVPILPLYIGGAGEPGLDPLERISFSVEDVPAHDALQAIATAALGEGGTWQLHQGRVEVGPKWILARDSAREGVVLPIRDLLLEPPTTQNFGADVREALKERFPEAVVAAGAGERSTPDVIAAELIIEIERHVEPDAWIVDEAMRASLVRSGEIDNPLSRSGQWATMTSRDGTLIVNAPDFVLRGIRGYPGALRPALDAAVVGASEAVQTEPVVVEQGGGRMVLLGFAPAERKRRVPPEAARGLSEAAIASAGRLVHARIHALLDNTTLKDAIDLLAQVTGATLQPRWASETGPGMDPASRVTLELHDASGRETLEILLTLAGASSECTWQLAGDGIEVGPKLVLARPEARRTVTLDVSDLLIEAPYFIGPGRSRARDGLLAIITPLERNYGRELGMSRNMNPPVGTAGEIRKSSQFIAAELLLLLEKHVEPKGWLPTDEQMARRAARGLRDFEPLQRDGAWIGVTYRNGSLVVAAPDFMLRGIVGYPTLPSPVASPK